MGWKSIRAARSGFDHELTGWQLKGKHAATDCDDCHKAQRQAGPQDVHGHRPAVRRRLPRQGSAAQVRAQGHARVRALPQRERVEAGRSARCSSTTTTARTRRCRCSAATSDVACTQVPPQERVQPAVRRSPTRAATAAVTRARTTATCSASATASGATRRRSSRSRTRRVFDHTERTRFDLGPAHSKLKCYDCHTKALGEAKPNGACEQCHAKDNHHGDRFKRVRLDRRSARPATRRADRSSRRARSTTARSTQVRARVQARRAGVPRRVTAARARRTSSASTFDPNKRVHGCHAHAKVHADDEHPNGKYKNAQCLQLPHAPRQSDDRRPRTTRSSSAVHGPQRHVPAGQGPQGRAVRRLPHRPRQEGQDVVRRDSSRTATRPASATRTRCTRARSASKCMACHSSGMWDALKFDHDKPFPDGRQGQGRRVPAQGRAQEEQVRGVPPEAQVRRDADATCSRRGLPRRRRRAQGPARRQVREVPRRDRRQHLQPQHDVGVPARRQAPRVRCADCHPSVTFKPRPTDCFGCHPEPAVHKGQYGTGCEQCHTTRTWEDVKPLHDVGDFSLKGAHDNIACERCHRDNRPLAGSGNLCINCHRQDDIHNNSLSPRCGECHTQWSFAPARFDHSRGRLQPDRPAPHARVLRLPQERQLRRRCRRSASSCHRDDAVKRGDRRAYAGAQHHAARRARTATTRTRGCGAAASAFGRESVCR